MTELDTFSPTKFVPYSYAKTQGAFVASITNGVAVIFLRDGAKLEAITEILRVWQGKFIPTQVSSTEYDRLLTDTYAQEGASSAFAEDLENNLNI